MLNPELIEYVRQQKAEGVTDSELVKSLSESFYSANDISELMHPQSTTQSKKRSASKEDLKKASDINQCFILLYGLIIVLVVSSQMEAFLDASYYQSLGFIALIAFLMACAISIRFHVNLRGEAITLKHKAFLIVTGLNLFLCASIVAAEYFPLFYSCQRGCTQAEGLGGLIIVSFLNLISLPLYPAVIILWTVSAALASQALDKGINQAN